MLFPAEHMKYLMTPLSFSNIKSTFCLQLPAGKAKHREAKALISQAGGYSSTTLGSLLGPRWARKRNFSFKWQILQFVSSANYSSSSAVCDIESWACQRAKLDPEKPAMGSISGTSSGSHASPCKKQQGREEALERRVRREGGKGSQKSPICVSLGVKSYLLRHEWHWQRCCQSFLSVCVSFMIPAPSTAPDTEPCARIVSTHQACLLYWLFCNTTCQYSTTLYFTYLSVGSKIRHLFLFLSLAILCWFLFSNVLYCSASSSNWTQLTESAEIHLCGDAPRLAVDLIF